MHNQTPVTLYSVPAMPSVWIARQGDEWFTVPPVWHGWHMRRKLMSPSPAMARLWERDCRVESHFGLGLDLPARAN